MQTVNPVNPKIITRLFEYVVDSAGITEFSLRNDAELRDAARIIKMEAFANSQVPFSPERRPVVSDAVFKKSSIKLVNNGGRELRHIALPSISKSVNTFFVDNINVQAIDFEKSKILIGEATGVVAGECYLFQITYEKI